ncbi:hydrogenase expression protein HypE, partial [Streptomyces sp. NPDC006393]
MTVQSGTSEVSREPQGAGERAGFDEIHILWISEGMSCDGDTVSITASGQPA